MKFIGYTSSSKGSDEPALPCSRIRAITGSTKFEVAMSNSLGEDAFTRNYII